MHAEDRARAPSAPPTPVEFVSGAPLGGVRPAVEAPPRRSDHRDLVLTATLLVLSIVASAASVLRWRDWGRQFGAPIVETGWQRPDGSLGHGWVAVLLAVILAVAGVLVAADRRGAGRLVAVLTGCALVALAVLEWGLGASESRTGPGIGLWVLLATGVLTIVAVGMTAPKAAPVDDPPSIASRF